MKWFATNKDIETLREQQNKLNETISVLSSRLGMAIASLERTQKNFAKAAAEIDTIKQQGDFGLYYDFPVNTLGMSEVVEEDKKAGRPTKTFKEP